MKKSGLTMVAWWLVIIGALNWGIYGLTGLFGDGWDVVSWILGSVPSLMNIVFLLVGIAAVVVLVKDCPSKKGMKKEKMSSSMDMHDSGMQGM